MELHELFKKSVENEIHGDGSAQISALTCDSRNVLPGTLFFALRGTSADGHHFIDKAVKAGAAAVVLEDESFAPNEIPWVRVADGRLAMGQIAATYNGEPTADLPLIGITGTNGKTTTTYIIEAIMAAAGLPAAVLGTISYRFGTTVIEASHTTPESTELQSAFRKLAEAGARSFVMEVSSHALEQKRADGCHFDVGIFTNLTRDHLDYHGNMENYLQAKQHLFRDLLRPNDLKPKRRAAVNMDDSYGTAIAECCACPVITYGIKNKCDVRPTDITSSVNGISGKLITPKGSFEFSSKLLGSFNLSNILAAATAGIGLDLPLVAIKSGIENHIIVPGRMERVENDYGVTCLVDYAHTDDALINVLTTLKEIATGRIITVFGCGGDRDNGKRPIMGRITVEMSDFAIVTSDNPRTDPPLSIMSQIKAGIIPLGVREYSLDECINITEKGFTMQEDRRKAIRLAVQLAKPGDIILLAGKGHEDYQIIGKVKNHFDDREEATAGFAEKSI